MKLCFVGPAASINLQRWTEWFVDRGHDCTIVTVEPAAPDRIMKFQQTNVTIGCCPGKLGRAVSALSMIRHIRRMKPDVVHVHYLRGLAWGLLADLPRPCVVTPWGSDVLADQGAYREWYSKALTCRLLSRADLVTTHSSYMEAQVRVVAPEVRSVVRVGWGVDLQRFRPNLDTSALRRRWNIHADQPVIFSPRLVQPLYNHDCVLQALPAVRRAIPGAVTVFTEYFADHAYLRRLRQLAIDLDMTEHVRFVGEVPHAEMPCWFNLARAVVMIPASDGLPNSLLEAMACGATPVLNGLLQYDELVRDRINGRRIALDAPELADALVQVLQDEPFRTRCRVENRRLMELNADQECEMSKMEDIYKHLVKGRYPVQEQPGAVMCAIAGIVGPNGYSVDPHVLQAMIATQAHRGPDGEGYVYLSYRRPGKPRFVTGPLASDERLDDALYSLGLGHRRLAVIDVTQAGAQPMADAEARHWVTYNGEIYNFIELRDELQALGHAFRSESDTEVLLAAYRQWGIDCLTKLNGMFAFALWDRERRELICARDRLGEKPLYYFWDGQCFAFASELKGLFPIVRNPVANHRMVYAYLDGGRLDFNDQTFVEQIRQLEPAHYLSIQEGRLRKRRYWDLSTVPSDESMPPDAVRDHFRMLFSDAVRIRLRSDVAVGSCLSGGLDSSSIVCVTHDLLARASDGVGRVIGNKPKTFSACFDEGLFDERRFMHEVTRSRAIDAHHTFPDPKELAEVLDRLVWQHDEPFGSTSSFAQWTVMRLASECGVKVLLDGQGADELLGGYHSFFGAYFVDLARAGRWVSLLQEVRAYRCRHGSIPAQAFGNLGRGVLPSWIVHAIRGVWSGNRRWMNAEFAHRWRSVEDPDSTEGSALLGMQQRLLTRNGLRALLHSEDRNSMAFGVEARLPFLDFRLVEFLYGLDGRWKLRDGWTKVLLREAMEGILPPAVQWRVDKIGFAAPEDKWFRHELKTIIEDCLADSRTQTRGYLNIEGARRALHAHVSGQAALGATLWRWLNIELWCRRFLDHRPCGAS